MLTTLLLFLVVSRVHAFEMRVWTDNTGKFHVEACVANSGAGVVTLEKKDGSQIQVPHNRLCQKDVAYLTQIFSAVAMIGEPTDEIVERINFVCEEYEQVHPDVIVPILQCAMKLQDSPPSDDKEMVEKTREYLCAVLGRTGRAGADVLVDMLVTLQMRSNYLDPYDKPSPKNVSALDVSDLCALGICYMDLRNAEYALREFRKKRKTVHDTLRNKHLDGCERMIVGGIRKMKTEKTARVTR